MDKTISISLGGFSFIIDDRAYLKLKSYLDEIRFSLNGMEGTDDILADVETRIAELFKDRLDFREVVNEEDVDHIIQIMGRPEQYVDSDSENEEPNNRKFNSSNEKVTKKLYRDPDDKIIAGVLAGISHYIGMETWIVRLVWILLFFVDTVVSFTTITVIGYIILWIILPKAKTISEKYEMYGQAGDFKTIKNNASQVASEMKGIASSASTSVGKLVGVFVKVIKFFIGLVLIVTGLGMVVASISIVIAFIGGFPLEFFGYVFDYDWQYTLAVVFAFILFFLPSLVITLLGARLISDRVKISKVFVISAFATWILISIVSAVMIVSFTRNYANDIEYVDKKAYNIASDTITLNFNEFKNKGKFQYRLLNIKMDDLREFEGGLHKKISDDIRIVQSSNDQVYVEIVYSAKGKNLDNAKLNAESIDYKYVVSPNGEIDFNRFLTLPKGSKFRDQNVKIYVYVPANKTIKTLNVDDVIFYDKLNDINNYNDGENKFYKFQNNDLICENCDDDFKHSKKEGGFRIINNADDADIRIDADGINVRSGKEKVIINQDQIHVTDGTDSVNISISGN